MTTKFLLLLGGVCQCVTANATSFIVEDRPSESGGKHLTYVDSVSKEQVDLPRVLREYGYDGAALPQSDEELHSYLQMYLESNQYLLSCDSRFLAPIKSTIWTIKFSLVSKSEYPDDAIKKLETFCTLISNADYNPEFQEFLIEVLFQKNGLRSLYAEIKALEKRFGTNLSSARLRSDCNKMLDIVDPNETIDRFRK